MKDRASAETFGALHRGADILILPNAWDAASAAIMADAGAKAVATSAAAVAWVHGYPDGGVLPMASLLATTEAMVRVAGIPVSVDIEGGYTDDLEIVGETFRKVINSGVAGINLEDGRRTPASHARKIELARKAADKEGVPLFINARIDVFLKGLAEGETAFEETIRRANLYRTAGASGIFVPGPREEEAIRRLASAIQLPLNVAIRPGLPAAARLQELGVRRVSSAGAPFRAAYATLAKTIEAFLRDGDPNAFGSGAELRGSLNARFGG